MKLIMTQVGTKEDIQHLAQLAAEIWQDYFIRIISQDQINYMLDKFQSTKAITEQMKHQDYEYYFMRINDVPIGYVGIQPKDGKLFLSKFYIHKLHRGQGYASQAIEWLVQLCSGRKINTIWLTVNRHNHDTVAIYEKKGFRAVRTEVADIGHGFVMDDYIMEKPIHLE